MEGAANSLEASIEEPRFKSCIPIKPALNEVHRLFRQVSLMQLGAFFDAFAQWLRDSDREYWKSPCRLKRAFRLLGFLHRVSLRSSGVSSRVIIYEPNRLTPALTGTTFVTLARIYELARQHKR